MKFDIDDCEFNEETNETPYLYLGHPFFNFEAKSHE